MASAGETIWSLGGRRRMRGAVVAGVAAVAIAAGLVWIFAPRGEAVTDDAYVTAPRLMITPKVRGMVTAVAVNENAPVAAGAVLVRIDPAEYQLKVRQAEGDVMAAEAAETAARSGLGRLDAEEELATNQVAAAEAAAGPKGATDPALRAAFSNARGQGLVAARTRGEITGSLAEARAAEFRARTELAAAEAQLAATTVTAPAAGVAANIQAEPGALVEPGVTLMTLIGQGPPTIVANFKENQIGRMRPGLAARVRVDALPGLTFTGHVESLAPGAASEFALIPFEPGSGNFTKIVQRVPVRIALDPGLPGVDRLRAGLSAVVTVTLSPAS